MIYFTVCGIKPNLLKCKMRQMCRAVAQCLKNDSKSLKFKKSISRAILVILDTKADETFLAIFNHCEIRP